MMQTLRVRELSMDITSFSRGGHWVVSTVFSIGVFASSKATEQTVSVSRFSHKIWENTQGC